MLRDAVERDGVVLAPIAAAFPNTNDDIGQAAATAARALVEQPGDVRVEADPSNIDEWAIVEHPDVDCEHLLAKRRGNGGVWISRHTETAGETVAGTSRDEPEGGRTAGKCAADFVDGAVAAPHDHEVCSIGDRGARQVARMAGPLSEVD